jgi:hypothetical protein
VGQGEAIVRLPGGELERNYYDRGREKLYYYYYRRS